MFFGRKRRDGIVLWHDLPACDNADDLSTLPKLPAWVTSGRAETPEDVAFLSGAALTTLHLVVTSEEVPHALWRERLALRAAGACVGFSGRPERAGVLRDAVHFLRPGDLPGPAGAIYLHWGRAVERAVSIKALHRALPTHPPEQIAAWLDAGQGGPVARAAATLETVLGEFPREEAAALILADAALAQACGWTYVVPLLAAGLKSGDLRKSGEGLRLACHRALVASASETVRMADDLARRAALLNAVVPKLRAKRAGAAINLFLTCDAVSPAALTNPADGVGRTGRTGMSDRAARRLCDRLVELGAVRELTGRDTFRLYGV